MIENSQHTGIFLSENDNVGCAKNNAAAIKRIAIVGGGITGWTVAAGLANGLRGLNIEIALIDHPAQTEIDLHTEATTPACVAFHRALGISELDLVMKTGASFLLATEFNAWSSAQQHYFMPFVDHGFMLNRIEFSQYAINHHLAGKSFNYDDYSLASVAAKAGRFCHPSAQSSSLFSTLDYGLALNTNAYTDYLSALAVPMGVTRIQAQTDGAMLDENGNIKAIRLCGADSTVNRNINPMWIDEAGSLAADLFIDCSGVAATLIETALHVKWLPLENVPPVSNASPLTHVLSSLRPLDTAAAIPVVRELQPAAAGWLQTCTTQTHIEKNYFYHADFASHEQTLAALGADLSAVKIHPLRTGRRATFWQNNCIAIGQAACNPDQLAAGKLHLAQSAVLRLLSLFPAQVDAVFNRAEYNRLAHLELDHIEDFHALHYQLALVPGADYWQTIARAQLSDRLLHKLELFKARGLIAHYENETFSAGIWASLLLGNGFWPQRCDPLVRSMDQTWIDQNLEKMKTMMKSAADAMPMHADYLQAARVKMHASINDVNAGYAMA